MTSSILGLLMLAVSLLSFVSDNQKLPPEKRLPVAIEQQAISLAAEVAKLASANLVASSTATTTLPLFSTSTPPAWTPPETVVNPHLLNVPSAPAPVSTPAPAPQAPQITIYPNNCPFPDLAQRNVITDGEKSYDANTGLRVDTQTMKCL